LGKVIFWIVVFFLVLLALRMVSVHKARREAREDKEERDAKGGNRDTTPVDDVMVRCAACGVFLPKANAVLSKGGMSCGNASCERLGKK
jgi:uncharacterized membrane protein YfcA